MNGYTVTHCVSLPVLNAVLRLPGSQVLKFVVLNESSQCRLTLLIRSVAFSDVIFSNCLSCARGLLGIA